MGALPGQELVEEAEKQHRGNQPESCMAMGKRGG